MKAPIMTHISQHTPIPFSFQDPFFSFNTPKTHLSAFTNLHCFPIIYFILGTNSLNFRKYFWVNISVVPRVNVCFIHKQSQGQIYFPLMTPYICSLFSVSIATTYIEDFTTSPPFNNYYWVLTCKWETPMQTTIPDKCYKGNG